MRARFRLLAMMSLAGSSWACGVDPLPPYGEVVLHVDTDLPAPRLAGRLRVDVYDGVGRWVESRDLARPNPDDWPLSFGVYTDQPEQALVWVRLRVYPEGKVREYRGERFQDWPEVLAEAPEGSGMPRLLREGVDATPAKEPEPLLTVDRLVLLEIPREARQHAVVMLRGDCVGTMPRLADSPTQGPTSGQASSCTSVSRERVELQPEPLLPAAPAGVSSQGGWANEPCVQPDDAERTCVPGGAMVFGNRSLVFADFTDAAPERVVAVRRFAMDTREVTVGGYRDTLARGFAPPQAPVVNDNPLMPSGDGACTFTSTASDREQYALNCLSWETARAFCRFHGGDLPTEAQWEFAATQAGRDQKTPFPWGEQEPSCDSVVFGRATLGGIPGQCASVGVGPAPVGSGESLDVAPAGVRGLGGGVAEWCRDGGAGYEDPCWDAGVVDPSCAPEGQPERSLRGGSWASPLGALVGTYRKAREASPGSSILGFRCVYEDAP